jgi:DNA-directed RNA polymerase specialized sigma24 family protein
MVSREFDEFFRRHWEPTVSCALGLRCTVPDAEDVAQNVLLEVWKNGQRCALQTMVRQHVIKLRRNALPLQRQVAEAATPDSGLQQMEVNDYLGVIPDQTDRVIIDMKLNCVSNAEAARTLGMTRAGIGKRLNRLRRQFSDWV